MAKEVQLVFDENAAAYMPFRELQNDNHRREVYEAVGDCLMALYAHNQGLRLAGDFVVRLDNGCQVAYSCGESGAIQEIS